MKVVPGINRGWKFLGLMALGLLGDGVGTVYGQTVTAGSWWVGLEVGFGYVPESRLPVERTTPLWGAGAWVALSPRAALGVEFQHERVRHTGDLDYVHSINYFLLSFQVWLEKPRLLARVNLGRFDDGGRTHGPAIGFSVGYAFPIGDRFYLSPELVFREYAFEDAIGSFTGIQLTLGVSSAREKATK